MILNPFILECFVQQLLFKRAFSRLREELNLPSKLAKISSKMSKKKLISNGLGVEREADAVRGKGCCEWGPGGIKLS